jgi:FAD/FMN-containing dehydrogenase
MDPTRREFAAGTLALAAASCGPRGGPTAPGTVNDITQLNPIRVSRVAEPRSVEEVASLIGDHRGPISIGGGRFSQGGQTACDGALFIDMRTLNRILSIDAVQRTITVESGATWRQIQEAVDPLGLSPAVMQSFCNFTVGGSLSVNCHGDYVGLGPVIESVRSIRIVTADGAVRIASRAENSDLFRAAIGGYGGVGVIVEATLDLAENTKLERLTHRMRVDEYVDWHRVNVLAREDVVLHHAVIYPDAYANIAAEVATRTDKPLTIADRLPPMGAPTAVERSVLDRPPGRSSTSASTIPSPRVRRSYGAITKPHATPTAWSRRHARASPTCCRNTSCRLIASPPSRRAWRRSSALTMRTCSTSRSATRAPTR